MRSSWSSCFGFFYCCTRPLGYVYSDMSSAEEPLLKGVVDSIPKRVIVISSEAAAVSVFVKLITVLCPEISFSLSSGNNYEIRVAVEKALLENSALYKHLKKLYRSNDFSVAKTSKQFIAELDSESLTGLKTKYANWACKPLLISEVSKIVTQVNAIFESNNKVETSEVEAADVEQPVSPKM